MRVGLFGGSFDPIHYGHLLLAESCREGQRLDEVWFLPAATAPHKRGRAASDAAARARMIELAIADQPAFRLCRYEVDRGGVNYTVDTLRALRGAHPAVEWFLLVGADMLADLPNWREAAEVCRLALPVAVGRPGFEVDWRAFAQLAGGARVEEMMRARVEMPAVAISSTEIRRRAAVGQSIRYLTPPAVAADIVASGRYR